MNKVVGVVPIYKQTEVVGVVPNPDLSGLGQTELPHLLNNIYGNNLLSQSLTTYRIFIGYYSKQLITECP
jgi:hypothetical protein